MSLFDDDAWLLDSPPSHASPAAAEGREELRLESLDEDGWD
jgi:hypothetical protein